MDYGTIVVFLQPGLTEEQTYVIVKQNVENQVMTKNRQHYNEILDQCANIVKLGQPVVVHWNLRDYRYTFRVEFIE